MTLPIVFGISEAARRTEVSEDTLRRYEALGIISPIRDEKTRRRIYNNQDVIAAREYRERTRQLRKTA